MLKTITRKEFRELLPFILLAAVAQIYLVSVAIRTTLGNSFSIVFKLLPAVGNRSSQIPFIDDMSCVYILVVAGLLAVAAGLWQTMWEENRGTSQFLLHRPLAWRGIFGTKLLLGATICFLAAALPIGYYALWAATPGNTSSPFLWSMTTRYWLLSTQIPLVYLGAFLSGLRPARLFGSKFFPLYAAVLIVLLLQVSPHLFLSWPIVLIITLMLEAGFVLAISNVVAVRDFA